LNPNPSKKIDRDAEEHYLDKDYGSPQSTNAKEMAGGGNGRPAAAYFWRAAAMAGRPAAIPTSGGRRWAAQQWSSSNPELSTCQANAAAVPGSHSAAVVSSNAW